MSYYEILGVKPDATAEQIKDAYRSLARQYHPDREGGDTEKMAEVNKAYACLSDPARRKQYDEGGGDNPVDNSASMAIQIALSAISEILSQGSPLEQDLVAEARRRISMRTHGLRQNIVQIERAQARLRKAAKKLMHKGSESKRGVLNDILFDQADQMTAQIEALKHDIEVLESGFKVLDEYDWEVIAALAGPPRGFDAPPFDTGMTAGSGRGTGGWRDWKP